MYAKCAEHTKLERLSNNNRIPIRGKVVLRDLAECYFFCLDYLDKIRKIRKGIKLVLFFEEIFIYTTLSTRF